MTQLINILWIIRVHILPALLCWALGRTVDVVEDMERTVEVVEDMLLSV